MPPVCITPSAVEVCASYGVCRPGAAAGQPMPVNMACLGGHAQVTPEIYLVLWGSDPGAFDHSGQTQGN